MEFTELIIPFEVEQKLLWKHRVNAYEIEETFQLRPLIRFVEKGHVRGRTFTWSWDEPMQGAT